MKVKKRVNISVDDETLQRLDELAEKVYRGVSRSQALRWIVEEKWEEIAKEPVSA
jgi:metal-responsive CopG/Arc/MetJ family transcriptional regulator